MNIRVLCREDRHAWRVDSWNICTVNEFCARCFENRTRDRIPGERPHVRAEMEHIQDADWRRIVEGPPLSGGAPRHLRPSPARAATRALVWVLCTVALALGLYLAVGAP